MNVNNNKNALFIVVFKSNDKWLATVVSFLLFLFIDTTNLVTGYVVWACLYRYATELLTIYVQ